MRILFARTTIAIYLATGAGAVAQTNTLPTGGDIPFLNIKPSVALHYVICATQGAFPSMGDGTLEQTDRSLPLIGEIRVLAFGNTPPGWKDCNGQLIPISQNTALFSQLFTTFGGDGVSVFGMPDLSGAVPIGVGQGPGLPNYALGQRVGTDYSYLYINNIPLHMHTIASGSTGSTGGLDTTLSTLQPSLPIHFYIDANGEIMMHAGYYVPRGFAECDGSLRDPSVDFTLFNVIGTKYGGDGQTTFALPDLRGRSPVCTNTVGLTTNGLGTPLGSATITLTPSMIPAHNHVIRSNVTTGFTGNSASFDLHQPTLSMSWSIANTGNTSNSANGPIFTGEMRLRAGGAPPAGTGWSPADGATYLISQTTQLFGTIGTIYGGNGLSTFSMPDLRNRMAANIGGLYSGLGATFTQATTTFGVTNLPAHVHALPFAPTLASLQRLGDGTYQFYFSNVPNNTFTVLTSTNLTLALSNWTSAGTVNQYALGYYSFNFAATNGPKRFYVVRVP